MDTLKNNPYQTAPETRNKYLGFSQEDLKQKGALHTAREIAQQPDLWLKTWELVSQRKDELAAFLQDAFRHPSLSVILTGAGTSAFIGDVLQGPFHKNTRKQTVAIPTTDLISHPAHYFNTEATLLISFARSGDSPESVAALHLADKFCEKVFHLIITCNPEGKLARSMETNTNPTLVFLLPREADDQSLAMTGSFTSMLLSGLLISRIKEIDTLREQVEQISRYARNILDNYHNKLKAAASLDFQRAIFLGSGPLRSVANESDLKVQELTDGKVICKFDSFLGFRHGPKAVINSSTLLVYLFSNNQYVHQYESDLVKAIISGEKGLFSIGITESADKDFEVDLLIELSTGGKTVDEEFLSVCSVLPAQILGFYKSLEFGLMPDNPSEKATITRVVKGVIIYPFSPENGKA
ncbi:SIS domain-containing protein [Chitinophaga sp. XS-30]|uniref:SIS domain-containing protein n=1 Tax=Chitinophaga sp. XS-30 TaxID=2604421 RepID=UPI0011DD4D6C|nr:SIS domain-containing protein [Chitinophaga sp. XS-30]QEH43372.1 SIS domain-containing protein [Chitinophaga sp. XS-30]